MSFTESSSIDFVLHFVKSKTAKLFFDDGMYWFNSLLFDLKCFVDET